MPTTVLHLSPAQLQWLADNNIGHTILPPERDGTPEPMPPPKAAAPASGGPSAPSDEAIYLSLFPNG